MQSVADRKARVVASIAAGCLCLAVMLIDQSAAAPVALPARYASSDDIQGYDFIGDQSIDFFLTSDGKQMYAGEVLHDIASWRTQEFNSEDRYWAFSSLCMPDGSAIVGELRYQGKQWIGLRHRQDAGGEPLFRVPNDFLGAQLLRMSGDGRGFFWMLSYRLQRPRQNPADDRPPTEDLNTRLRVSTHYAEPRDDKRIPRVYADAYAERERNYVGYFDLKTRQLRLIFTGNDINRIALSPDEKRFLAIQVKAEKPGQQREGTTFADAYIVTIPPLEALPSIDLFKAKEEGRNAGWMDHAKQRMAPALRDIGISFFTEVSWSPDGSQFVWAATGTNHGGDVWVYDLATKKAQNLTAKIDLAAVEPRMPEPLEHQLPSAHRRFNSKADFPRWIPGTAAILVTARGHLWHLSADGSQAENLSSSNQGPGIAEVIGMRGESNLAYLSADEILVRTTDVQTVLDGIARFNLKTRVLTPIVEQAGGVTHPQVDAANGMLYYAAITPDKPRQVYQYALTSQVTGAPRQLTEFQKELNVFRMPEKVLLAFTTKSGRKGWARLYLPHSDDKTRRWPVVLMRELSNPVRAYGRMPSRWDIDRDQWGSADYWRMNGVQAYTREIEMFNAAGYALMYFDLPLSHRGEYEDLRETVVQAYDAATDAALRTGRIDERRMALWATSFDVNGTFQLIALAQRERYGAAAMFGGFGMMSSQALSAQVPYGEIVTRYSEGRMGGSFIEHPQRYFAASPLTFMQNLKTPLLAMHSLNDAWIEPQRTEEVFCAIQPLGVKSVAAFYNKLRYDPEEDSYRRAIYWFDEHLQGGPSYAARAALPLLEGKDLGITSTVVTRSGSH